MPCKYKYCVYNLYCYSYKHFKSKNLYLSDFTLSLISDSNLSLCLATQSRMTCLLWDESVTVLRYDSKVSVSSRSRSRWNNSTNTTGEKEKHEGVWHTDSCIDIAALPFFFSMHESNCKLHHSVPPLWWGGSAKTWEEGRINKFSDKIHFCQADFEQPGGRGGGGGRLNRALSWQNAPSLSIVRHSISVCILRANIPPTVPATHRYYSSMHFSAAGYTVFSVQVTPNQTKKLTACYVKVHDCVVKAWYSETVH